MANDMMAAMMRIAQQNPGLMSAFMGQGNGIMPMAPQFQTVPKGPERFGIPQQAPPVRQPNLLGAPLMQGPLVEQGMDRAREANRATMAPPVQPTTPSPAPGAISPEIAAMLMRQGMTASRNRELQNALKNGASANRIRAIIQGAR